MHLMTAGHDGLAFTITENSCSELISFVQHHPSSRSSFSSSFGKHLLNAYCKPGIRLSQRYSTSAPFTFWSKKAFVVGGCPVHCTILSSIPDLYLLDASRSLPSSPSHNNKNISRHSTKCPWAGGKITS